MSLLDFTVFHVGGKGGIGDALSILKFGKKVPNQKKLFVFEADLSDDGDLKANKTYVRKLRKRHGVEARILNYCVSDKTEETNFYINKDRWSSSMFKIDPRAYNYLMESENGNLWRDHCDIDKTMTVNTTTFDEIYKNELQIKPDFLSMDAQASELSILKGATSFMDDLLGVITEVEFRELYENQPLFADQDIVLRDNGFIFINMMTSQYWFMGLGGGRGCLTVGEVIYLKDYMVLVNKYESDLDKLFILTTKLAWIAHSMKYSSYAFAIMDYMFKRWDKEYKLYISNSDDLMIIRMLEFYRQWRK